jgi:hypothetical protein
MQIKIHSPDEKSGWEWYTPPENTYPFKPVKCASGKTSSWYCDVCDQIPIQICLECNEDMEHIIEGMSLYNYCKKCEIHGWITSNPNPPDDNIFELTDEEHDILLTQGEEALTKFLIENGRLTKAECGLG